MEKYHPTKQDVQAAQNMLTKEQRRASEIRARYYEQVLSRWQPYEKKYVDKNFDRMPPSSEEARNMNKRIAKLGEVFEGCDLNWHLDGALNISLMSEKGKNGETNYIGLHKDVDLSIEKDELAGLEAHLLKKGYGLFLSRTDNKLKRKVLRRVGYADFRDTPAEHILIAAIDEHGKVLKKLPLSAVDVHLIKRNEAGQPLGESGVVIPEKWALPYPVEFQGKQINLSHPGKVLYYKLHQTRGYDLTDIKRLVDAGRLTEDDVAEVEDVFKKEFAANLERGRQVFDGLARQLTPEMSANQIFDVMLQQPELKKNAKRMKKVLLELAKNISEAGLRTTDKIIGEISRLTGYKKKNNEKIEQVRTIGQLVADMEKIKAVRERLDK